MIWADRVAIALFVLIAIGFGIAFVSSDAPLREAAYRAKAAKFAAACAPPEPSAEARPATAESSAAVAAASEATTSEPSASESTNPQASIVAPAEIPRLPASICADEKLKAEREAEAESVKAPTVTGVLTDIGEAELFFVAPLWVGLRILDVRTGGPARRLARSPYWKATHGVRAARRRKRRGPSNAGS